MNKDFELSSVDFEILDFLSKNTDVELECIESKFSDIDEIKFRLDQLASENIVSEKVERKGNGIFAKYLHLGIYSLTNKGKTLLRNHKESNRNSAFRFWFPIIVSNLISLAALIISIAALKK